MEFKDIKNLSEILSEKCEELGITSLIIIVDPHTETANVTGTHCSNIGIEQAASVFFEENDIVTVFEEIINRKEELKKH
jgi:CO dehydrogenase/acetyl-CoA synthase gamma subunit (corrinoid Fe-S protein)